tara:strand:- start:3457 stop:3762 length:306 start_codon:yes stop_codon:yes gene_type:complete
MIKKIFRFLNNVLGLPYQFVKLSIKSFISSTKWTWKQIKKISIKGIAKWLFDVVKESIAQIFTLLGFFIAWFTLTGTAQDIVGIAIVVSTIIWLVTIRLRD